MAGESDKSFASGDTSPSSPPAHTRVAGFDASPVNVAVVGRLILAFAVGILGILFGLWQLENALAPGGQPPRTEALDVDQSLQPSPGHPVLPWQDMQAMRAEQQRQLHSYGPIAGDSAHQHIPIERAMDLVLQSGELRQTWKPPSTLPYQTETQPSPWVQPFMRNRT